MGEKQRKMVVYGVFHKEESLVIPEGYTELHTNGCAENNLLREVVLPEGFLKISEGGFSKCSNLHKVKLPSTLQYIGKASFMGCEALEEIEIPAQTGRIERYAFADCRSLRSVRFLSDRQKIGGAAFLGCRSLADENGFVIVKGVLYDCFSEENRIEIPDTVTEISAFALAHVPEGCMVCIPRSVERIAERISTRKKVRLYLYRWSKGLQELLNKKDADIEVYPSEFRVVPNNLRLFVFIEMLKAPADRREPTVWKEACCWMGEHALLHLNEIRKTPEILLAMLEQKTLRAEDIEIMLNVVDSINQPALKAAVLEYQNVLGMDTVRKARERKEKAAEAHADRFFEKIAGRTEANGIEGFCFCVIGKLEYWPSHEKVREYLERYGAAMSDTVNEYTDYLVTDGTCNQKTIAAKALEIEELDEETFNNMVGRFFRNERVVKVPEWMTDPEPTAFSACRSMEIAILRNGMRRIPEEMFAGLENLQQIRIPGSVIEICARAFSRCRSLKTIDFEPGLERIGENAFSRCAKLCVLRLPEGLKSIGKEAFSGCCGLQQVTLPDSLETIEEGAFDRCGTLQITAAKRVLALYQRSMFVIKNGHLRSYIGPSGEVEVPSGIKTLKEHAFSDSMAREVSLPEGLTEIGNKAFYQCTSLHRIHLPQTLTKLGDFAFHMCEALTEVNLPDLLRELPASVFGSCAALEKIKLPEELEKVRWRAFEHCISLKEIVLPPKALVLEPASFCNCTLLEHVTLPERLIAVPDHMLSYCTSLRQIKIPDGVRYIFEGAFQGCTALKTAQLPAALKEISNDAFSGCTSLQELSLPDELETIGNRAFQDCGTLEEVNIPKNVWLGESAFRGCAKLSRVMITENKPHLRWNRPVRLTELKAMTFHNCASLHEVWLPRGLEQIGESAFENCTSLTELYLPETVQKVAESAFMGCALQTILGVPGSYAQTLAISMGIAFREFTPPPIRIVPIDRK